MTDKGFHPGEILGGKYRLQSLVAEGGMGSVWLANHLLLDRSCAVKLLNATGGSQAVRSERFAREAKIAASLRHKNVVDLFDFGETGSGDFFMVMEWLQGESLAQRLTRHPALPLCELVQIVADGLLGLAAVHDKGIVHRDLKPENIFLATEDGVVIPKILDFGVSRLRGVPGASITAAGSTVGTPHYMSNEQVRGKRDLDGRSDLYSLGVLLFRSVCGRFPFDSDELTDLLMQVADGVVPRLVPLRLEAGEALSAVIDKATAKAPADRFSNALHMRRALLAALPTFAPTVPSLWMGNSDGLVAPFGVASRSWGSGGEAPPTPGRLTTGSWTSQWRRFIPVGLALLVIGTAWLLLAR